MDTSGIETYPVGLFADVRHRRVRYGLRNYLARQIRRRNWRAVRAYFNGYLAEWHFPPTDPAYRHPGFAGKGWTRRGALRDLGRKIVAANLHDREKDRAA